MYRIASRIATVGFVVYLLGVGYPAQAQAEERLREMPKVGADPQGGQVEQLPLPHELGIETRIWTESGPATFCERPLNCTRINRYEIWQFYEVGHQGRFRPRVIYSPSGSYYSDDGRPYPWVSNHSLDFMPYAVSP